MMTLHLDKPAFRLLIQQIHEATGFRMDVLEKDYYVTLILHELAQKQANGLKAYFKGGTALYKALKWPRRFSEDIDLSVDASDCSRTQNDKRLRQSTKEYEALDRNAAQDITQRSVVISAYTYVPEMEYDKDDLLQRFGLLKVEATSFTIAEPFQPMEVSPLLYDFATDAQRAVLERQYGVTSMQVLTMTLERIFVDKLFAAEAYTRTADIGNHAFDASKHIYDLCVLYEEPSIQPLLRNDEALDHLLELRMHEETNRLDGIPNVELADFCFFRDAMRIPSVLRAYDIMQNQYVLRSADRIPARKAAQALIDLGIDLGVLPPQKEMAKSCHRGGEER